MRRLTATMVAALLASLIAGESSLAKSNVQEAKLAQAACDASCTSRYATCVRGCNDGGGAQVQACLAGCQTGLKACAVAVLKCHTPDSTRLGN